MIRVGLPTFLLLSLIASPVAVVSGRAEGRNTRLAMQNGQFVLDGKPIQIISGEMHYVRIPRAYWRDRFRMAKAMGLNTITTYVFWNVHEPRPGAYDFSGNNDVAEFVREAQQEGLYVILRLGPYVCAEWEFGGYPAWLLKDRSMVIRSGDPRYFSAADRWIKRAAVELAPLQIGSGGPILLIQMENEYGSFGEDRGYLSQLRRALLDAGFTQSQLYTADPPDAISKGSLPEVPIGINFSAEKRQNAEKSFATLKGLRPNGPFLNSELWAGWFDHWGEVHERTDTSKEAANLDWLLRQGYSVSLYMFHGGTSFGWMNGANSDKNGNNYQPDVTSYDYDAPLDESGRPTSKYFAFRDVIANDTGVTPPAVPVSAPPASLPEVRMNEAVSLWNTLPVPIHSKQPLSMEDVDQAYGYILYRTQIKGPVTGDLVLEDLHDYAQVYVGGHLVGRLDRRLSESRLPLDVKGHSVQLDILVENSGRVNYTAGLLGERKGITKEVRLDGQPVLEWDIYPLPMLEPATFAFSNAACEGACFYRGVFQVDAPRDTFLDTSAFQKGEVWLNGHALGRIWNIGPQKTLYVPGPWLHRGDNSVIVFDLKGEPGRSLVGHEKPILGSPLQWLFSRVLRHRWLSVLAAGAFISLSVVSCWLILSRNKENSVVPGLIS